MSKRLREADARAVDLLLDRAVSSAQADGDGMMYTAASHLGVSNEQIGAVEKVLSLLNVIPSPDPAQDLLRRTMERIANTSDHADAPLRGSILTDTTARPHA